MLPNFSRSACIHGIGELKDLVHEEGKKVQKKKVEGKMLHPVAEVVFDVVALVLERVEGFVLDLPPAPAYPHEFFDVLLATERSVTHALWYVRFPLSWSS